MTSLALFFVNPTNPELDRTEISFSGATTSLLCVRGRTSDVFSNNQKTFVWGTAVQAFAVLCLRTAAAASSQADKDSPLWRIEGQEQSYATSLDYALSKQPAWIYDMFGTDSSGRSMWRKIVCRHNPERKRPGPVIISLKDSFQRSGALRIWLNGREENDPKGLCALAAVIESNKRQRSHVSAKRTPRGAAAQPPGNEPRKDAEFSILSARQPRSILSAFATESGRPFLNSLFYREVSTMLYMTDIFDARSVREQVRQINTDVTFKKIVGRFLDLTHSIDRTLMNSQVLAGSADDWVKLFKQNCDSMTVALGPCQAPALSLLYQLKLHYGLPLEVAFSEPHSVAIIKSLAAGGVKKDPELLLLTVPAAATFLAGRRRKDYFPFMLMPRISHRVVSGRNDRPNPDALNSGRFLFMTETPGTSTFYLNNLFKYGLLKKRKIQVVHSEPADISRALQAGEEDVRGVMSFPHYSFNRVFTGCQYLDPPGLNISSIGTVMLVHSKLQFEEDLLASLSGAIRAVWRRNTEDPSTLKASVDVLLSDVNYLSSLLRSGGLEHLSTQNIGSISTVAH